MSTVGAHDVPPSRERATPPTWTLTWMAPSSATAIDRTSAGSPQGVYQASRPSTVSNDGMGASPAPVSRKRRACSVPTRTPSRVGATHVAGVWTWDRLRDPDDGGGPGVPEAWTVLTALAEVTRRVSLGPLVLNVANRPPGVLANMAATLQTVSGGRLLLGLGAGGNRRTPYAAEQAAIGQPVERDAVRAQRVVDAIALIRRLWAGESGFLRPEPPPPIIVGGFGPRMAAVAGRHPDGSSSPGPASARRSSAAP